MLTPGNPRSKENITVKMFSGIKTPTNARAAFMNVSAEIPLIILLKDLNVECSDFKIICVTKSVKKAIGKIRILIKNILSPYSFSIGFNFSMKYWYFALSELR